MFLRLGWVVGQAGIIQSILIVLLSGVVTTITTCSMSAICTNGTVKGGGAYYLISRSLGPAVGGAIGTMFFVGMCVACAMYVIGFCETLVDNMGVCPNTICSAANIAQFSNMTGCASATELLTGCEQSKIIFTITSIKMMDLRIYGVALITFLLIMALIGTGWVIKLQLGLFVLLVATILSFCIGVFIHEGAADTANGFVGFFGQVKVPNPANATSFSYASNLYTNLWPGYTTQNGKEYNFFAVFAIFFPAVTGIMAGANISGLLQNPSENIPTGTFNAIVHSTIVYCIMAVLIGAGVTRETLLVDNLIMAKIELASGVLVFAGVCRFQAKEEREREREITAIATEVELTETLARACFFLFFSTHKHAHGGRQTLPPFRRPSPRSSARRSSSSPWPRTQSSRFPSSPSPTSARAPALSRSTARSAKRAATAWSSTVTTTAG